MQELFERTRRKETEMLNIVIPMAGHGSRFAKAGYQMPKPLIEIKGHRMIEWVVKNVAPKSPHRFIFLCLQEHIDRYSLQSFLREIAPGCVVVPVEQVTEGAACTVLLAQKYIDNDQPLMIANSDQYLDCDIDAYLKEQQGRDGLIMTMYADGEQWSFIAADGEGLVTEVREKEVISNQATAGVYNFAWGSDYVRYAREMIAMDLRVKGEFYVAPVYNMLIGDGKKVAFKNIGSVGDGMYGLGVPEDLKAFLDHPISHRPPF